MRFIVFVVVLIVVVRFITIMVGGKSAGTAPSPTSSTSGQLQAFVARLRESAAMQRARIQSRTGTGFRSPPTFPVVPPTPAAPSAVVPPPVPPPQPSTPSDQPAPAKQPTTSTASPTITGPRLVPLTPELERRAKELMSQGHEVMAVRLLCDELGVGILDAQKTVRTLVGLPTPY